MFDTAYGNYEKKYSKESKKKKKESGRQKISSKEHLTGILTELPGNRNFFPVAGINSGQTGIMAGLHYPFLAIQSHAYVKTQGTGFVF